MEHISVFTNYICHTIVHKIINLDLDIYFYNGIICIVLIISAITQVIGGVMH